MSLSPAALREMFALQQQAKQLLSQSTVTRSDSKKADLLIARISTIKQTGLASDEIRNQLVDELGREINDDPEHRKLFRDYLRGVDDSEIQRRATNLLAGTQAVTYTQGAAGGFLVPVSFQQKVTEGLAATDPLLDSSVVDLVQESGFTLPPLTVPGWDLSAATAVKVGEATQQNAQVIPAIDSKMLNKFTYRASLAASFEFEQDAKGYGDAYAAMGRAFGIAFARGIGQDLVNGDGSSAPQGIAVGAHNSGFTAAGQFDLDFFTNVFFSVNPAYRASAKCAWLMSDAAYKLARKAKDGAQRPLIDIVEGESRILGKPVYVAPSLTSAVVFGDLSHYIVHASTMFLRRRIQTPGYVEYGKTLFTGLLMVDAVVHDPTDGALPPIVYATLTS